MKSGGRDADDLELATGHPDRVRRCRAGVEAPAPHPIIDHGDSRTAAPVVAGLKQPSGRGLQPEHRKVVSADGFSSRPLTGAVGDDHSLERRVRGDGREHRLRLPKILEVGQRHRHGNGPPRNGSSGRC